MIDDNISSTWKCARTPELLDLAGKNVWLSRVHPQHARSLFSQSHGAEADPALWHFLAVGPFVDLDSFALWLETCTQSKDPLYFTIRDVKTSCPCGMASYSRINPTHGVVEIGNIWFGRSLKQTPQATEAIYLLTRYAFDDLGYRRLEWKCDALNEASRRAAARLGFRYEGCFRQHMIIKGRNRDTAWFSIIDKEWPSARAAIETWLAPENFDGEGRQRRSLATVRASNQGIARHSFVRSDGQIYPAR